MAAARRDLELCGDGSPGRHPGRLRRLAEKAEPLAKAGLRRVNVSMDSMRPERFHEITRRDGLSEVLRGLEAAATAGLSPIRINAVVVRGVNVDEVVDFAALARERDLHVRFIEYMPLDAGHRWTQEQVVPSAELKVRIEDASSFVGRRPPSQGRRCPTCSRTAPPAAWDSSPRSANRSAEPAAGFA